MNNIAGNIDEMCDPALKIIQSGMKKLTSMNSESLVYDAVSPRIVRV
jgi:hypothetical protein